jgi:pullulanase/glycogen debranching enzyme
MSKEKPSIQELIQIGLNVAKFIADKVKSGEWSGRFRKTTKESIESHSAALEKLAEAQQASAEIQAQLYLKITDLEKRLQEVESLYMYGKKQG